jgi:hypothetical protein
MLKSKLLHPLTRRRHTCISQPWTHQNLAHHKKQTLHSICTSPSKVLHDSIKRPNKSYTSKKLGQEITQQQYISHSDRKSKKKSTYLGTLCPGDECLADVPHAEDRRRLDVVPILLGEGVDAARQRGEQTSDRGKEGRRVGARKSKLTSSSCHPSSPWRSACSCRLPLRLPLGALDVKERRLREGFAPRGWVGYWRWCLRWGSRVSAVWYWAFGDG